MLQKFFLSMTIALQVFVGEVRGGGGMKGQSVRGLLFPKAAKVSHIASSILHPAKLNPLLAFGTHPAFIFFHLESY